VQPAVEERALAEAGPGLDPEIGRSLGPAGARDQDPLAGLPVDEEEREEVVAQGLVVEPVDYRLADLGLGLGRGDRRAQPQQGRLPQGEVALALDRAGDRRGVQWTALQMWLEKDVHGKIAQPY
jgi:hypothetical protein